LEYDDNVIMTAEQKIRSLKDEIEKWADLFWEK
jgi:hypothetical protein